MEKPNGHHDRGKNTRKLMSKGLWGPHLTSLPSHPIGYINCKDTWEMWSHCVQEGESYVLRLDRNLSCINVLVKMHPSCFVFLSIKSGVWTFLPSKSSFRLCNDLSMLLWRHFIFPELSMASGAVWNSSPHFWHAGPRGRSAVSSPVLMAVGLLRDIP